MDLGAPRETVVFQGSAEVEGMLSRELNPSDLHNRPLSPKRLEPMETGRPTCPNGVNKGGMPPEMIVFRTRRTGV